MPAKQPPSRPKVGRALTMKAARDGCLDLHQDGESQSPPDNDLDVRPRTDQTCVDYLPVDIILAPPVVCSYPRGARAWHRTLRRNLPSLQALHRMLIKLSE